MRYYVSRQSYWGIEPEERYCVEIAEGGLNYANPDMLVSKYVEGEYDNTLDAVNAAIEIRDAWQSDEPELNIRIDYGFTGGYTMPFLSQNTDEELLQWANSQIDNMPKCSRCGKPYEENCGWSHQFSDYEFCSEYCTNKDWDEVDEEDEEEGE